MRNLLDYVEKQYTKVATPNLSKDELELASKINKYFIEHKPMFRQEVLTYFGISKHMFYKLKKENAIQVPYEISNRTYSSRNKGKVKHGQRTKKSDTQI
jgi:hypothetical protein